MAAAASRPDVVGGAVDATSPGLAPAPRYAVVNSSPAASPRVIFLEDHAAGLVAGVCPSLGAELCSLSLRGVELLHRALDFSPATAPGDYYGHGQLLFPGVGRQRDGVYSSGVGGAAATPMPLHGFCSAAPFVECARAADDAAGASFSCVLESGPGPSPWAASYPFAFRLEITFRVRDGVLSVSHRVRHEAAAGSGALMPFAVGNHITLRFPFESGPDASSSWAAGRLLSTLTHEHALTPGSLLSGELIARPELQSAVGLPLTAPSATNGVFGFDSRRADAGAGECSLMLVQPGGISVEVSQAVTAVPASSAPACDWTQVSANRHFVLWGTPPQDISGAQGFLCPEPWLSGPDSLNSRKGLAVLRGGEEAEWTFYVAATTARGNART